MAPLNPSLTITAAAHGNIETAHDAPADNLFLILRFDAFRLHPAATMRAPLREWNCNPFIHACRNGAACLPTIAAPGFAARALRIGFRVTPRVRCSLTLTGTQRGFQFSPQPLRLLPQAFVLFAQPLVFLLRPVQFPLRDKFDAVGLPVCVGRADRFHPNLR
jgi:hypothetical protein